MHWDRPILTDSGGFQVFSLNDLRKITEEIKKLTDLKQDKIKLEQSLENKIQSRERILNSFNQKKQAKNK
jgi:tRNA-guanine family transglycosylase